MGTLALHRSSNDLRLCGEVPCNVNYGASATPYISPDARQIANAAMRDSLLGGSGPVLAPR